MAAASSKKRRWPWLVAAALLFGLSAWLMAGSEDVKTNKQPKVSLPRFMTSDERMRNDSRQTMPVIAAPAPSFGEKPAARPGDPVLAGMPAEITKGAVVIEANAIRNSDLGNLMVECMFTGQSDVLEKMKDAGFDPLEKLDRVAVADDTLMVTGDFSKTDLPALFKSDTQRQFGANSELFTRQAGLDGGTTQGMGVWKGQVMVFGDTEEQITTVLDRLDGKGSTDPTAPRVLTDADAYGEIYGVFKPGPFARDLQDENPALARLIEEAATSIKLHADVSHDVGVVADIVGTDPAKTQDLRKMIGTSLTLAKLQAEAQGNKDAAEVLGFARVAQAKGDGANFHLEAGLPYEFLEKHLKKFVEDKKKRLAEKEASPK